jgi:hypothetical protein
MYLVCIIWRKIKMERKFLLIGIIALIIICVFSFIYIYGSGPVKQDDFGFEDGVDDKNESNEPKEWEQLVGFGVGPMSTPMTNWGITPSCTEPYLIHSDLWRIDWNVDGTDDSYFELKVYRVGVMGHVFGEIITEGKTHDEGTIVIDNVVDYNYAPSYYYLKIEYNEVYQYGFKILEYQ